MLNHWLVWIIFPKKRKKNRYQYSLPFRFKPPGQIQQKTEAAFQSRAILTECQITDPMIHTSVSYLSYTFFPDQVISFNSISMLYPVPSLLPCFFIGNPSICEISTKMNHDQNYCNFIFIKGCPDT